MEILKFNENINSTDRVYKKHGKPLYKRIIDYYNSKGYKLYYYDNEKFKLIEILSTRKDGQMGRFRWKSDWGEFIFFLNDDEYNEAIKTIKTSKDLYDKHIESAKTISKIPLSNIYHNILKINK